jgi:hypothetical protein
MLIVDRASSGEPGMDRIESRNGPAIPARCSTVLHVMWFHG